MTFSLKDILVLFSPVKCSVMSAVPVTSSAAPVQEITIALVSGVSRVMCPFL